MAPSGREEPAATLEHRLKRLMLLRVVMITTLLLVAIAVEAVSETLLPANPLYFLIAATYALTLLYVWVLRASGYHVGLAWVQVGLDLLLITGLVYLTGGPRAQASFILLYPIAVLAGSVLLYRRSGVVLAGVATVFYGSMLLAVREGWVPPQALGYVRAMPVKHVLYSVFVTAVSCVTVALVGAYLSESVRSIGARLAVATGQVADLQELHRVVVTSMHSGLVTADAGARILFVNDYGARILDRLPRELVGHQLADAFGTMLLDPPALRARTLTQGLERLELDYRRPNGEVVALGLSVSPLASTQPGAAGFLLVFADVTEMKRLEKEVRAKENLAAVGEMAARLAHEIRNPLASISGSAQMLMAEPGLSAEQAQLLAIITRESRRLSETLSGFLVQARPPTARLGPVDLSRVVEEAFTLLRNSPEVRPGHSLSFERDDGPHVCLADPAQITQVFWNLARNALEAMPQGGALRLRLRRERDDVVLSVVDQGRGIAREEQPRVFEPFRSGTPVGTGLGLAIVYHIVKQHHGDIVVRSVPQKGTEVEVRLPLVAAAVSA